MEFQKLSPEKVIEIKVLSRQGIGRSRLARKYNVSEATIKYWTSEKYRKKQQDKGKSKGFYY